jgi:hypothetical protein
MLVKTKTDAIKDKTIQTTFKRALKKDNLLRIQKNIINITTINKRNGM